MSDLGGGGRDLRHLSTPSTAGHADGMDDSAVVEMCRVLGDPIRWRVVRELHGGTRCAWELAGASGAAPSLLSHHLAVLREAGVVTGTRRGRRIDYSLESGQLTDLSREIAAAVPARSSAVSGGPDDVLAGNAVVG